MPSMEQRAVVAAAAISAAGSIPYHVMSFIVALAATDGLLSVAEAGWIGGLYTAGTLVATILLPLAGARRVTRLPLIAGLTLLAGALAWGTLARSTAALLGGWFVAGLVGGLYAFLGSTAAAASPDRLLAFGTRLGLVLLLAAAVIGGAHLSGGFRSYGHAVLVVGVGITVVTLAALKSYRAPSLAAGRPAQAASGIEQAGGGVGGLVVAALFFAGQTGFYAYAILLALRNGVSGEDLALIYVAAKLVAAGVVLSWGTRERVGAPTAAMGMLIALAVVTVAVSRDVSMFAAGIGVWHIAVNVQSTRVQAVAVACDPVRLGRWLAAAMAIGATSGPVAHGALLSVGAGAWFIGFTVLSGALPWAWSRQVNRSPRATAPGAPPTKTAGG